MSSQLELTVAIIKPHALKVPATVKGIQQIILGNGFYVVRSKKELMRANVAELFYAEHKNKFFYGRLISLMTSGTSKMLILARENAILKWRELMGPTKVYKAQITHPNTIRGKFGLTDTRNATHGSDSPESTSKEMSILFPDFNGDLWYQTEEPYFRANNVVFDRTNFVHRVQQSSE